MSATFARAHQLCAGITPSAAQVVPTIFHSGLIQSDVTVLNAGGYIDLTAVHVTTTTAAGSPNCKPQAASPWAPC